MCQNVVNNHINIKKKVYKFCGEMMPDSDMKIEKKNLMQLTY